jgi:abequosyltransferase
MLLSICIPTYNYEEYITDCLNSILNQDIETTKYEIVIGDSSSNNKTTEIVKKFKKKNKNIIYKKFQKKSGIDIDIEKTIKMCSGQYILFFSSDDFLKPNALDTIFKNLSSKNTIYLFNRIICDIMLKEKKRTNWLSKNINNSVFYLKKNKSLLKFLDNSTSIGAIFSYMSSIIVNRKIYLDTKIDPDFIGTNYLHVQKILNILFKDDRSLKYLSSHLVYFRGENDSFKKNGYVNRILMDFTCYKLLHKKFFSKEEVSESFLKIMRNEHKFYYLIRVGEYFKNNTEWLNFKEYLKYYKYNLFQIYIIRLLGKSKLIINSLRKLKKLFEF